MGRNKRINKYPGVCIRCGEMVGKGKGFLSRTRNRFALRHFECIKKDQKETSSVKSTEDLPTAKNGYQKELI